MSIKTRNKILNLFVRVGISITILTVLVTRIDFHDIKESLINTNHTVLIIGILIYTLSQVLSAYKWKLIANNAGFSNKLKEYIDYYFVGLFFNLFLPTTVGGDISKAYYLSKHDLQNRKAPAIYSVLAERYSGVVVIVWLGTFILFTPLGNPVPAVFKVLMSFLTILIFIITPAFPAFWMQFFKRKKWVRTMLRDIRAYWSNPKLVVKVIYWSVLYHMLVLGIHLLIGSAMGIKVPVGYYIMAYTMASMAGFLPVAFNGIGPREWAYIYFLSFAGVRESDALIFSIFWFGIILSSSLFGGIFYLKGQLLPAPNEFDNESDLETDEADCSLETPFLASSQANAENIIITETGVNKIESAI
jgi:hypothetical protein